MKKRIALFVAGALLILVLLSPILLRKYTVPLTSNGRVVAVAKRPFVLPWNENEFGVYVEGSKAFGLWGDAWDYPLFICPLADGKKFLCIFDDDTSVLVFVVDLDNPNAKVGTTHPWPVNDDLRKHMASRMKEVVIDPKGIVRLPTYSELSEVTLNLASQTPGQINAGSFPQVDFGFYRAYWPKEALLSEIDPNRQSVWP